MSSTTLLQRPTMTVSDFRCTAQPGEKPFAELHRCHSISFVRKGSFGYHCRGRSHDLVAGSLLIGSPGTEFVCTHDHVCGDECLSFFFEPELIETIGERAEAWQVGATPPLAELMVLGELAQAAADGQSDIGLDEAGHLIASRLVEVVSGKREEAAERHRARPPPRGGGGALDRRPFAPGDRAGGCRAAGRRQPVPFPAAVFRKPRRHPASISGALAAAARGALPRRRRQARDRHRL